MSKRVFISYSHHQGQWVCERLVPILRAAGCADVLLDRERFRAGRGLKAQMDATQDQADVSLLVLTPDYLASDYCRHELQRALASDPDFRRDRVLPVQRADCDLSAFQRASDPPLRVNLTHDTDPAPWSIELGDDVDPMPNYENALTDRPSPACRMKRRRLRLPVGRPRCALAGQF